MNVNEFQELLFDEQRDILFVYINEKTADITDEDFKNAQFAIIEELAIRKCKNLIINLQKLLFSISPELQEWTATEIAPNLFKNNVIKVAYIMPKGFIENLAAEQTIEEMDEQVFKQRPDFGIEFFDNEKEAIAWCISINTASQKHKV